MKGFLLTPVMALCAFLPTGAGNVSATDVPQQSLVALDHADGEAHGTVVVWHHYTTGDPTAHLRGTLHDNYGKKFGEIVARLEDWGGVTGYALTEYGYYSLRGGWFFDKYDKEGWFGLEFDYGDSREVKLDGHFDGYRSRWWTEWEFAERY